MPVGVTALFLGVRFSIPLVQFLSVPQEESEHACACVRTAASCGFFLLVPYPKKVGKGYPLRLMHAHVVVHLTPLGCQRG